MAKGSSIDKAQSDLAEQVKTLAEHEPSKALTILETAVNACRNANRKYRAASMVQKE